MPRKTLRILCFGDSLTQGFYSFGMGENPYSARLAERLQAVLPEGTTLEMRTSGVPGDVAAFPRFRERFTQLMRKNLRNRRAHPSFYGRRMTLTPFPRPAQSHQGPLTGSLR